MRATTIAPITRTFERQQVALLVGRCQVLAGEFKQLSSATLITKMNELVAQLPLSLNGAEQMMISGIMDHFLARLVRMAGIDGRPEVVEGFLNLADTRPAADRWRVQWFRATEQCSATLPNDAGGRKYRITDERVIRMMRVVHARYRDSRLSMRQVAQTINLCPSYGARLLKQQTGFGFLTHLHQYRIVLARRLLVESPFSIKEIAATVGYADPSQFSRHFKLACGQTPRVFRTTRRGSVESA